MGIVRISQLRTQAKYDFHLLKALAYNFKKITTICTYNEMILNVYRSTISSTKQVYGLLFFFVQMHLFDYVTATWRTYLSSLTQKCNLHQFMYHYLSISEKRTLQLVLIWTRNATWPFLSQRAFSIKNWKNLIE